MESRLAGRAADGKQAEGRRPRRFGGRRADAGPRDVSAAPGRPPCEASPPRRV